MTDPVAHDGASEGVGGPQRRLGMRLVEIFADRAALVERPPVFEDQQRNDAVGVELQKRRRMVLHLRKVDELALEGEPLFGEAEPHPTRRGRSPSVIEGVHEVTPVERQSLRRL